VMPVRSSLLLQIMLEIEMFIGFTWAFSYLLYIVRRVSWRKL